MLQAKRKTPEAYEVSKRGDPFGSRESGGVLHVPMLAADGAGNNNHGKGLCMVRLVLNVHPIVLNRRHHPPLYSSLQVVGALTVV